MANHKSASYMLNMYRPREKMKYIVQDAREHILHAFEVQKIFPVAEVRPGWFEENARRQRSGGSYSTGDAYRTLDLRYEFIGQSQDQFPATTLITFTAPGYLGYVDYGVGKKRKVREVQRSAPARREERYATWNVPAKDTHRPVFRKEMRHLARRSSLYLSTYSGRLYEAYMIKGLQGFITQGGDGAISFANLEVKNT